VREEAKNLLAAAYGVLDYFGVAAGLAIVIFAAYIIGIIVQVAIFQIVPPSRRALASVSLNNRSRTLQIADERVLAARRSHVPFVELANMLKLSSFRGDRCEEVQRYLDAGNVKSPAEEEKYYKIARLELSHRLQSLMVAELPSVAHRLLASHKEVFDKHDRAFAEADFRLGIAAPLAALSFAVFFQVGPGSEGLWATMLGSAVILAFTVALAMRGIQKQVESNDVIYQAVFADQAQFPIIDRIDALSVHSKARFDGIRNFSLASNLQKYRVGPRRRFMRAIGLA
jgi:hypothetical protein